MLRKKSKAESQTFFFFFPQRNLFPLISSVETSAELIIHLVSPILMCVGLDETGFEWLLGGEAIELT